MMVSAMTSPPNRWLGSNAYDGFGLSLRVIRSVVLRVPDTFPNEDFLKPMNNGLAKAFGTSKRLSVAGIEVAPEPNVDSLHCWTRRKAAYVFGEDDKELILVQGFEAVTFKK